MYPHTGIGGFSFMIAYQTGGLQEELMLQTGIIHRMTSSAAGDRQIFPRQTNKILSIAI